jgi:hypothetical protein
MKSPKFLLSIAAIAFAGWMIWSIFSQAFRNVKGLEAIGPGRMQFAITADDSLLLSDIALNEMSPSRSASTIRKNGRESLVGLKGGTQILITDLFFPDSINLIEDLKFKPVKKDDLSEEKGLTSGFYNGEFYINGLNIPKKFSTCQYEQGRNLDIIVRTKDLIHIRGNLGFLNFADSQTNKKRTVGIQFKKKTTSVETILYNSPQGLVLIIVNHKRNIDLERILNLQ